MNANNFLFKAGQSKKSTLDKAYNKHINNILVSIDEEEEDRWETYSLIVQELINHGKGDYFKELKYRITDGENANKVILDIIERDAEGMNNFVWFFKRRIEEYLEEDFFRQFYI